MLDGPRALRPSEFDALMELVDDTFRGPDWPRPSHAKLYSLMLNPRTNCEGMRVFVADGRPVAHFGLYVRPVHCGGTTLRVASVGSVCTHPDFRGEGLATQLVQDALQLCKQQGVHMMLISGGRGLYRRRGACDVGEMVTYRLNEDDAVQDTTVHLEPWRDELLPLCAALYQREPFRFHRSLDDWRRVARGSSDMNRQAETYLIHEDGELRAYASVLEPYDGESGFLEYAGSRQTLMAAIPAWFQQYELSRFHVTVPWFDLEWHRTCRGLPSESGTIEDHTALLVDVPGLTVALAPYLIERIGTEACPTEFGDGWPCHIASPHGQVGIPDITMLTQLVLGPHTPEIQQTLAEAGVLGEQLSRTFPLCFGYPGLNFV